MNLVSMLLNSNASKTMGNTRARYTGSSPKFGGSSRDFSRVLNSKLSVEQTRNQTEFQLDVQQVELSRSSAESAKSARAREQESNGGSKRGSEGGFGGGKESQRDVSEFFRNRRETFGDRQQDHGESDGRVGKSARFNRFKNNQTAGSGIDQSGQSDGADRTNQSIREVIRDQYQSEKKSEAFREKLSQSDRRVMKKIEEGSFDPTDEQDVEDLKELLEKMTKSESGTAKETGVNLLEQLFGSSGNLQELFDSDASGEELIEGLKNVHELLKRSQNLIDSLSETVNESVVDQLKQGFEKLKDGDEDDSQLNKLLQQIETALEKESNQQSSGFQQSLKELTKQVEQLIQSFQESNGEGSGQSGSESNQRDQVNSLVKQLSETFGQLGGDGSSDSVSGETIKQFKQAVRTAEQQLSETSLKETLAKHLSEFQEEQRLADVGGRGKGDGSSEAGNSSKSSGGDGRESGESSGKDDTASESNKGSENKSADSSDKKSTATDQNERTRRDEARKQQEEGQSEQAKSDSSGSDEVKQSDSEAEKSSSAGNSAGESDSADEDSDSKSSSTAANGKKPSSDSEARPNLNQTTAEKNAQNTASKSQSSDGSSSTNKSSTSADSNQASQSQGETTKSSQEFLRTEAVRQTETGENGRIRPGQIDQTSQSVRQFSEALSEEVIDRTSQASEESQTAPAVDGDRSAAKENQANGKNIGKMAQYESNAAQAVQSTDGSGAEFSNQGNQQQSNQGQASVRTQSPAGSDFSERMREARKVIKQMVEKAQTLVENDKQTMKIQLQPPELGEMKMSISLEGDSAKANVQVEKKAVKGLLDENMNQLKQSMEGIGVDLDEVEVSEYENEQSDNDGDFWFDEGDEAVDTAGEEAEEPTDSAPDRGHTRPTREYSSIELVA